MEVKKGGTKYCPACGKWSLFNTFVSSSSFARLRCGNLGCGWTGQVERKATFLDPEETALKDRIAQKMKGEPWARS